VPAGTRSAKDTQRDYRAEERRLPPLPMGATWNPAVIQSADDHGVPVTYQYGLGFQFADSHWECLWLGKILQDSTTSPDYGRDLAILGRYTSTYIYVNQSDARALFDPMYSAARLGDTSGLSHAYSSCTG